MDVFRKFWRRRCRIMAVANCDRHLHFARDFHSRGSSHRECVTRENAIPHCNAPATRRLSCRRERARPAHSAGRAKRFTQATCPVIGISDGEECAVPTGAQGGQKHGSPAVAGLLLPAPAGSFNGPCLTPPVPAIVRGYLLTAGV